MIVRFLIYTMGITTSHVLKKGKIILQYDSAEELEAIYEAMERLENE